MRVIATAGHVDHGKSALVQVLSGIDPDRLQEEQARGLTIDLGFAWIELPRLADESDDGPTQESGEGVGIVDVPGHIDFIKNMLAGVGSVDAALLVIAADEGVMPQTREHLAILDLLAVPTGVVALTKTDLVDDPEWLELVEWDVRDLLEGTRLAAASIVPVSAVTGSGLDELRQALAQALVQLPPRRDRGRPRLPIDRVFSLSGFGTIVTGTLSDGHFGLGDAVEILPGGQEARIRGLQTHKQSIERAQPGSRVAINLSGVGTDEISRGDVVARPSTLRSTVLVDVAFRLLPDAPKPLMHNQRVDLFSGASEIPAHVRLLGTEALQPGEEGWLQLRLARPVVLVAGDRYILRQPSPSRTLGGGVVLDPAPRQRYRRFDPAVVQRLQTLARGAPDEVLLQTLERQPLLARDELIGQSGLGVDPAQTALAELVEAEAVVSLDGGQPLFLATATWQDLLVQLQELLRHFHRRSPLRQGMPRGELRSRLQVAGSGGRRRELGLRPFNDLIERATEANLVQADDTVVWLADHAVRFTEVQQAAVDRTLAVFAASPYAPPNAPDTLALLDNNEALLEALIEQNHLVRLPGDVLFRRRDFEAMVEQIRAYIEANGSITLAQSRDLFATSRKYAQAVLEETDARRITRREGDIRVLR